MVHTGLFDGLGLTPRQIAFIFEYSRTAAPVISARAAGYSDKTARSHAGALLKNDAVLEGLARLAEQCPKSTIADEGELHRFFTAILRGDGAAGIPPNADAALIQAARRRGVDIRDRLRAAELLSKARGFQPPAGGAAGAGESEDDDSVIVYVPDNGRDPELRKNGAKGSKETPGEADADAVGGISDQDI